MSAKVIVEKCSLQGFDELMVSESLRLLEDPEVRVRLAVGQLLRSLAAKLGVEVYQRCQKTVLESIHDHFDREGEGNRADSNFSSGFSTPAAAYNSAGNDPGSPTAAAPGSPGSNDLLAALLATSYQPLVPGVGVMRHGTEGWKCLETSMKAMQQLMEGTGQQVAPFITDDLLELLIRSVRHPNRYVRETAHFTIATLCEALEGPRLLGAGQDLAECLADGMTDNWSQVRYAACVATRNFMRCVGEDGERFLPTLTGPMCLNRYYVAEGVRRFAQDTWRQVMGTSGPTQVAKHINQVTEKLFSGCWGHPVVFYHISQSKASNHVVREAACAVIAELMDKVERPAVAPHVPDLLRALLLCFKDSSWPVRDAACTACGRCVLSYPEESREVLDSLYSLWFDHLSDNIPTVREDSAMALAKAITAYGEEAVAQVVDVLRRLLPEAYKQPAESERYSDLDNTTTFGAAARRARDNDPAVHTNQDMFSCGSLAARFSTDRLVRGDGCNDFGVPRAKEPWEASDGAVYMVRELAAVAPAAAVEFVPQLADLARLSTFQHAYNMHETIWRSLPSIAQCVGIKEFKQQYLELFLQPLFADLRCGHQLAEAEAGACISKLRDLIGARIFAGRLDEVQKAALESPREVSEHGAKVWPDSRHGMCGDKVSEQHWDMPGKVQATYKQGQVINVDFLIAENHLGRINIDFCELDAENQQPSKCQSLHRADGKGGHWYLPFLSNWTGGNPGVQLPAYGDGSFSWYRLPSISQEHGCSQWQCDQFSNMIVYRTRWRLPAGSACRHCKLQWHYQSAQNCWPPCEEANRDEVTCENHQVFGVCGTPGTAYPEEFWNCADIRVLDDSSARMQRRVKKSNVPSWESSITLETHVLMYDEAQDLDEVAAAGTPAKSLNKVPAWKRLLWEGGHPADAFLTAASAQVGQVILNLPNSMAKCGVGLGTVFQVTCASAAVYTLWLLSALYQEFKRQAVKDGSWFNDKETGRRTRVTQYHSVITGVTGARWLGEFARVVNIVELLGLSVAQIIASASNFYSLDTGLYKRDFTFIFGAIAVLMAMVPSFRNMRIFAFLALVGTTYTSWYMMGESWKHGLVPGAASRPPQGLENVFAGLSNILFTEVLDSQFRPSKFPKAFTYALLYVTSTLTLPNAIFTFLAFPEEATKYGNAFAIFPSSPAKYVGIVLMVAHQLVSYGLFILPVCIMFEKLTRTHYKSLWCRLPSRLPVALFVWFIALLLPFFGVINDLLGAFAVTLETYIIPCVAFNMHYQGKPDRQARAIFKPSRFLGWGGVFAINYVIIAATAVAGLGFGGYASVVALIESIGKFGVFAKCYNC
eukprot:gene5826-6067_t